MVVRDSLLLGHAPEHRDRRRHSHGADIGTYRADVEPLAERHVRYDLHGVGLHLLGDSFLLRRRDGADEFIAQLPQGYDTMIEERGANLSGGQRQRIAIARALVTNPRVLILDEATSALDYESERIIQDNMRSIVHGRTVIIIAHRLAAVRPCSQIVGMLRGEIVEVGGHEELLRRKDGLYARLWALQSDHIGAPA